MLFYTGRITLKRLSRILYLSLLILLCTCTINMASDRQSIFVTIEPQRYFVQQIGGDFVDCQVMVPTGADAHTYEPKPRQMAALSGARLYFATGIEFEEANLDKIISINPTIKVVHIDEGIKKIPMKSHHHEGDRHSEAGKEARHEKRSLDPHIWLSPPLVKIQAASILKGLNEIDPAHKDEYEANYKNFISSVEQLDAELKALFKEKSGMKFIVFHPAWGYFAENYGLEQVPVEIEGKEPKPAQLKELISHARENNIKVIFAQPQFSVKSAKVVASEIGGEVIFADPMAYEWLTNLRNVADKFREALK
ncbi:MAG: zinc ABC transporter substrate-binding protein [Deltaproteobacteria bacterium]|nr:zinc ABC transporter substrate-binding protein [Deltaproteobacteria bacterium]